LKGFERSLEKLIFNLKLKRKTEFGDSMKKSTTYIVVAVVIVIIIIAAAAAYVYMNPSEGGATPTPTATATPLSVVGATSLQFDVQESPGTETALNYTYSTKNFNATNELLRVDIPASNYILVVNLEDSTSASSTDGGATWTAGNFNEDAAFASLLNDYVTVLQNDWDGHSDSVNYTNIGGNSGIITAIHVNPTLEDSYFATS
jgi:hypothetical protein